MHIGRSLQVLVTFKVCGLIIYAYIWRILVLYSIPPIG